MTYTIVTSWSRDVNWRTAHDVIQSAMLPLRPEEDYSVHLRGVHSGQPLTRYIEINQFGRTVTEAQLTLILLRLTGHLA